MIFFLFDTENTLQEKEEMLVTSIQGHSQSRLCGEEFIRTALSVSVLLVLSKTSRQEDQSTQHDAPLKTLANFPHNKTQR